MVIHKAYKFRLYPTKEQQILIGKTIGCSRFVFNRFLSEWNQSYKDTGKGLSYGTCSANLTALKKEADTLFLKEVDSIALQSSLRNLSDSFERFFKNQNSAPRFKSKRNPVHRKHRYRGKQIETTQFGTGPVCKVQRSGRKDPECHHKAEPVGQIFHLHFSRNRSSGTA